MDKILKRWNDLAGINQPKEPVRSSNSLQETYGNSFVKDLLNEEGLADKLKAAAEGGGDSEVEGAEALENEKATISDSEMIKKFRSGDMKSLIKSIPPVLNDEFQAVIKIASEVAADGDKSMMVKLIKKMESLTGKSAGMDFSKEAEEE
jgi:hypothetical protein